MHNRIKTLRKELGLTQKEFGERIGVKSNTIGTYEIGRNKPIDAVVSLICREFNVREAWLRTGEGEMFVHRSPEDELTAAVERLLTGESAEFKRRLVTALSTLSEEHWLMLETKCREIAGLDATPEASDDDVEKDVENYRQRRLLEKNQEAGSSPSSEGGAETA